MTVKMKIDFVSDVSCPWCIIGLNAFDAALLTLAGEVEAEGRQRALKIALFTAYFTDGRDPSDHAVLAEVADSVGLDSAGAAQVIEI